MIGRSVLVKVVAFAVITVLGIGYVLVHYMEVARGVLGNGYTAYVDLTDSGGIFTTASVTYRGVEVGRVGKIELRPDGIRVSLDMKGDHRVPADTRAVVGNGSAIGEQYVELQPLVDHGPYLHDGSVIPQSRTSLPVTTQTLLVDVDKLVNSVPRDDLRSLVGELGAAFSETGPALRRLLASSHDLVATAQQNLPQTVRLLDDGRTVLDTQNALGNSIVDFSRHLASFTDQVRASDGDIRKVLQQGVPAAVQVTDLAHSVDATLPVLLGNLVSVGQVSAVRVPAIRQVFVIYPYIVATSMGLFPGNSTTRFGVPVPPNFQAQACIKGYLPPADRRPPNEMKFPPLRWNSYCKAPTQDPIDPRGSRQAPIPGGGRLGDDPSYQANDGLPRTNGISTSGGSTQGLGSPGGRNYVLASTGGQQRLLGDRSWTWLVLGPLAE